MEMSVEKSPWLLTSLSALIRVSYRELEKSPTLLISALPAHPAEYAALPGSFAPRPRTIKMVHPRPPPIRLTFKFFQATR
jgi:hypothetical protein